MWTLTQALNLAKAIEAVCVQHHYHVALTGGLLYKGGDRKDADFIFYQVRWKTPDREGLLKSLKELGIQFDTHVGWLEKCTFEGRQLDLMFPEYVMTKEEMEWAMDHGYVRH